MQAPKPPRLAPQQKKLWNTLTFLLRLTVLAIPLYIVIWLNLSLVPLQSVVADQSAWILGAMGFAVTKNNLILSVGGASPFTSSPFTFYIGPDCTGWKSMLAFVALIFATLGVAMKKRVLGLVFGIPLIHLGNLSRIIIVVLIERGLGLDAALVFHDWLWQAGLMAIVLFLWLVWLKWEKAASTLSSVKPLMMKLKAGKGPHT